MRVGCVGRRGCGRLRSLRDAYWASRGAPVGRKSDSVGSGLAGEGYAGDLLQVVDEADGFPVGEESGDFVALALADFEGEEAVGFEGGVGLGDEAAVDREAVGTGEERGGGLVVSDLGVQGVPVGGGDVRRVGDEHFVLFSTRSARECGVLYIRGC